MIIGVLLLVWPNRGAETVIMLVGAFALLTGLVATIHASTTRYPLWRMSVAGGLLTLALGLVALFWPGLTATVLILIVAIWALAFGVIEILAGVTVGAGSPIGALVTGIGLVSVILAILLFAAPDIGVVAAAWLIAFYLLAYGGLTIYQAVELRRSASRVEII